MLVKNCRPISLFPIFGKMFERVIYNPIFIYFQSNRLFTPSQSGFLPGDLCIAQLLSIIHQIQTAFDENLTVDVRGVFLDISKAFDKIWHDGIIFKLQANGVILSRKISSNTLLHPPIKFSNNDISKCPHQNPLGIVFDSKLNFSAHVDKK